MNQIELGHVSGCRKKQNKRKTYKYGRVQFIAILVNIVLLLLLLSLIILLFRLYGDGGRGKIRLPHLRARFKLRK